MTSTVYCWAYASLLLYGIAGKRGDILPDSKRFSPPMAAPEASHMLCRAMVNGGRGWVWAKRKPCFIPVFREAILSLLSNRLIHVEAWFFHGLSHYLYRNLDYKWFCSFSKALSHRIKAFTSNILNLYTLIWILIKASKTQRYVSEMIIITRTAV